MLLVTHVVRLKLFRLKRSEEHDCRTLAENLVFLELIRRGYEVHYWKDKREVDFIAQKEGRTLAINVCYEDVIPERETEGLKELRDSDFRSDELFLVTRDTKPRRGPILKA